MRNKLASGITISVEASSDVTFPGTLATTVLSPVDLGADLEQITVRGSAALNSITRTFFRVKIPRLDWPPGNAFDTGCGLG